MNTTQSTEPKPTTTNETDTASEQTVILTDNAAHKVWSLIVEEENADLRLRAFISGGGCSGFEYNFMFEDPNDEPQGHGDDSVFQKQITADNPFQQTDTATVTLVIDPMSLQYLIGATIDYKEDINGAQFVIRNPNAKTTCGCGSSFSA